MSGIVASFEKTAFSSRVQLLFRWGWHPRHPQPQLIVVLPLLQLKAISQTGSKSKVLSARDADDMFKLETPEKCFLLHLAP
jgi:hypothetical protein